MHKLMALDDLNETTIGAHLNVEAKSYWPSMKVLSHEPEGDLL